MSDGGSDRAEPALSDESAGVAPGRRRLIGRRIVVVGAGTRPSADPNAPIGNGRAIAVLAAREGAAVACVDIDRAAAEHTADLVRAEGAQATVIEADVADADTCASLVAQSVDLSLIHI